MRRGGQAQVSDEQRIQLDEWRAAGLDGTFEAALATLDEIVAFLETGRHGLDETVAAYELGVAMASRCQQLLSAAELRISQITVDTELARRSLAVPIEDEDEDDDDSDESTAEAPF